MDESGGYPVYAAGVALMDTDNDGIPDAWEKAHGLNKNEARDATRRRKTGNGYLAIEEYINSLLADG